MKQQQEHKWKNQQNMKRSEIETQNYHQYISRERDALYYYEG
jgi:hypothetical protein